MLIYSDSWFGFSVPQQVLVSVVLIWMQQKGAEPRHLQTHLSHNGVNILHPLSSSSRLLLLMGILWRSKSSWLSRSWVGPRVKLLGEASAPGPRPHIE